MNLAIFLFLLTLTSAYGYHIFCVQGGPSRSHYNVVIGIVKVLLKAGHEVTMVTPYPDLKPMKNLHVIDVSPLIGVLEDLDLADQSKVSLASMKNFARTLSNMVIETPAVRDALINKQFDAVITEWFMTDTEAGYAAVQQVPWILISSAPLLPNMEMLVESISSVSTVPVLFNDVPIPMNFFRRIMNTIWASLIFIDSWMDTTQNHDYEKYFGEIAKVRGVPLPPFLKAKHNISILLANSHPSIAPAKSLPLNVIDIAGYHIDDDVPPLPKDLQDLLDSSKQGVIYFSMGSAFKSASLPEKAKKDLVQLFGELPYTVLWKYEEALENLPKNLHIRPWMPQSSILGKYYKKAQFMSQLFRNRPVHPSKLIQYYVELAIETGGAYHLRSKTHLYEWYQVWMLDQLAVLVLVLFLCYKLLKLALCKFICKNTRKGFKQKTY